MPFSEPITLLMVSRGRPDGFRRAVDSARRLAKHKIQVLSYFDDDDPTLADYPEYNVIGPRKYLGKSLLELLPMVDTRFCFLGADDIEFMTQDWDQKLLDAMPEDELAIVYGSDNEDPKFYCAHFMFSMKWHNLVGLYGPGFHHVHIDQWIREVGHGVDRVIKVPDVMVKHHHWRTGLAQWDDTYRGTKLRNIDDLNYLRSTRHIREQHIETLRKCLSAPTPS